MQQRNKFVVGGFPVIYEWWREAGTVYAQHIWLKRKRPIKLEGVPEGHESAELGKYLKRLASSKKGRSEIELAWKIEGQPKI